MRKIIVLAVIIVLASATIALASWQVADWIKGDKGGSGGEKASVSVAEAGSDGPAGIQADEQADGEVADLTGKAGGDEASYEAADVDPDMRYVTETQRHQNFLAALAEGRIKRLDAVGTDVQPAGDNNSSFVYVIITTTDGAKTDGTFVLKYSGGMWRLGAIRLAGSLAGGVNITAPSTFEEDLAREMEQLQDFWKKVAEGRLKYMYYHTVNQISDTEVQLIGEVAGKGGGVYPAEMDLRKDYGLWHITNIVAL